jgi:hypothetical protein
MLLIGFVQFVQLVIVLKFVNFFLISTSPNLPPKPHLPSLAPSTATSNGSSCIAKSSFPFTEQPELNYTTISFDAANASQNGKRMENGILYTKYGDGRESPGTTLASFLDNISIYICHTFNYSFFSYFVSSQFSLQLNLTQ